MIQTRAKAIIHLFDLFKLKIFITFDRRMRNASLRMLIEAIQGCGSLSEKCTLVRERVHSFADLKEVANALSGTRSGRRCMVRLGKNPSCKGSNKAEWAKHSNKKYTAVGIPQRRISYGYTSFSFCSVSSGFSFCSSSAKRLIFCVVVLTNSFSRTTSFLIFL